MEKFNTLKSLVLGIEEDAKKFFDKKNSAAGTRVRKAMQEIKVLAQELRLEVSEIKNQDNG